MPEHTNSLRPWQHTLHEAIFEADTPAGEAFDVALLIAIVLSVIALCLESVMSYRERFGEYMRLMEWGFTILFTVEYLLRLISVGRPLRYSVSFFGMVDLIAVLPTYLSLIFVGTQSLLVIRALRLLTLPMRSSVLTCEDSRCKDAACFPHRPVGSHKGLSRSEFTLLTWIERTSFSCSWRSYWSCCWPRR
jgi:hypothetical protein